MPEANPLAGGSPALMVGQGVTPLANPLAQIQGWQGVRGQMNQNALFQAQQARGQVMQQAIDPATGTYDPAKANQLLAATPQAALAAPEAVGQNQNLAQQQQSRSFEAQGHVNQTLVSMLTLPDDKLSPDAVKSSIDQLRARGSITAQDEQAALSDLPQGGDAGAMRQYLARHAVQNLGGPEAMQQVFGTPGSLNTGNATYSGVQRSAMMGGGFQPGSVAQQGFAPTFGASGESSSIPIINGQPVGPGITQKLTPGENISQVQGPIGPNGERTTLTAADYARIHGMGGLAAPQPSPFGTGRIPSALRNPNAPPTATSAPVQVGLSPAKEAQLTTQGADSAKAFQDISSQGVQAQSQVATLSNMLGDTSQFTTGPGADRIKAFQASLQRFAPQIASQFGVTPESLAANESFDKFAAQLANAQGAGSDARLAVNQSANPSSHLTPAGVDMILRQLQGNADYLGARSKLAASYPDQTNRAGFEAQVGSNLDPRVFQYARMTPTQKGTFLSNMKDKSQFKQAYGWASQNGLVTAGQQAQAAPASSPAAAVQAAPAVAPGAAVPPAYVPQVPVN
jgi:hypothetical protein